MQTLADSDSDGAEFDQDHDVSSDTDTESEQSRPRSRSSGSGSTTPRSISRSMFSLNFAQEARNSGQGLRSGRVKKKKKVTLFYSVQMSPCLTQAVDARDLLHF